MKAADWLARFSQNAIDLDRPLASALRWVPWSAAILRGRPVVTALGKSGLRMRLTPRLKQFGTTSIFIKRDAYEPELRMCAQLVRPGTVAIDIGASYGIYSLFMAQAAGPEGRIHAFEPGAFSFGELTANIALNPGIAEISAHRVAASDKAQTLALFHIGGSPVNFSLGGESGLDREDIAADRADAVVPRAEWPRVSFIKADVEGYELFALSGASQIIEASRPRIMFEVSRDALARQGLVPRDVYKMLATYGYCFWRWNGQQLERVDDTMPEGNIFASVDDLAARCAA